MTTLGARPAGQEPPVDFAQLQACKGRLEWNDIVSSAYAMTRGVEA